MSSNRFYPALVAILALVTGMVLSYKIILGWPSTILRNRIIDTRVKMVGLIDQFIIDVVAQAPDSEAVKAAGAAAKWQLQTFRLFDPSKDQELVDSLVYLTHVYGLHQQLQRTDSVAA